MRALGSWQQDEAEGAWAQAVVQLPYLPAPAPGCYLRVVHLQSLGSKPHVTLSQRTLCLPLEGLHHFLRLVAMVSQKRLCLN